MKALIFAAGLGTRLMPLTKNKPKALVELAGKPMLERVITSLQKQGINEFVVNVHHFADKIIDFLKDNNNFGADIQISDERELLLETGGGLLKAKELLADSEDFIVHNADVFTNIDLKKAISRHQSSQSLATLCVQNRNSARKFGFDNNGLLCAWKNFDTGEEKISRKAEGNLQYKGFTGVHILNRRIFDLIEARGKFSITPEYLRLAENQAIHAFEADAYFWFDIGKPETLAEATEFIQENDL